MYIFIFFLCIAILVTKLGFFGKCGEIPFLADTCPLPLCQDFVESGLRFLKHGQQGLFLQLHEMVSGGGGGGSTSDNIDRSFAVHNFCPRSSHLTRYLLHGNVCMFHRFKDHLGWNWWVACPACPACPLFLGPSWQQRIASNEMLKTGGVYCNLAAIKSTGKILTVVLVCLKVLWYSYISILVMVVMRKQFVLLDCLVFLFAGCLVRKSRKLFVGRLFDYLQQLGPAWDCGSPYL